MHTVTCDVKDSRSKISKTARKRLGPEKVAARRAFRTRLKAADRNNDFDGFVKPAFTAYDVT
jgi:hypothetical protein